MQSIDVLIIGGGPAGLAAAIGAKEAGAQSVLILEREECLGGILNQCIHNGFGLHRFKEELTGPEYAQRDIDRVQELEIPYKLETTVLDISPQRVVTVVNATDGMLQYQAGAVVLAMGCRERPRGAINIQGTRSAGVYTAGSAQRFVNLMGYMPGREVVILGSGDIGLIMARRMTLEGAKVKAVVELLPYSGGLTRNIVQCLDDFSIPLLFSHTVTEVHGRDRVEGVVIAKVDENRRPIAGTEQHISCDTLLLSVGLLPENELSRETGVELSSITGGPVVNETLQTQIPGIFACGNVLHVHDLVDFVSEESYIAGKNAAAFVMGATFEQEAVTVQTENGVRYTVPEKIRTHAVRETIYLRLRVDQPYRNKRLSVYFDNTQVQSIKKKVLTPGEMETLRLKPEVFAKHPVCRNITVRLEDWA